MNVRVDMKDGFYEYLAGLEGRAIEVVRTPNEGAELHFSGGYVIGVIDIIWVNYLREKRRQLRAG